MHEAYLKLVGQQPVPWTSRAQFLGIAAHLMRQILIQHARHRQAVKRGGARTKLSLEAVVVGCEAPAVDLVALDAALTRLAAVDPSKSRIVDLRFFGGLTIAETGEVLGVSTATVERSWRLAKLWLRSEIESAQREA